MLIEINHLTTYSYNRPMRNGIQELRLMPRDTTCQRVVDWKIDAPGIEKAPEWIDAWGNKVRLINQVGEREELSIGVSGTIETISGDGIVGQLPGENTPRLFLRFTTLTEPSSGIARIAERLRGRHRDQVALYHALMAEIGEAMRFETGTTRSTTTAADALKQGHGVCQDFSHIFISVCRLLDQPARYVTGYMVLDEEAKTADAHHAWVEAEVAGLGWVGFDPANGICPDRRYVRLACGLDSDTAAPVRGIRNGHGNENLRVNVSVTDVS